MPVLTVTAGTPAVSAGTYLAELIDVTPKRMVTQYSKNGEEQDFLEWTWLVHADDDIEVTSLTTTAMTPKSRLVNEYWPALAGADKVLIGVSFDTDKFIGKTVMVSTVVTDQGFAKIDKIVAAPKAPRPVRAAAPTGPAQVTIEEVAEDDLPF